jgi:hypothetical protein
MALPPCSWRHRGIKLGALLFLFSLVFVRPVLATQVHGDPEGLYAHQIGHVFFIFSMAILIYWLRDRRLVKIKGWRYVQYAALFFILWNAGAFLTHHFEEIGGFFTVKRTGLMSSTISFSRENYILGLLLYFIKMDHLVLLPAIMFLHAGLRHLVKDAERQDLQPSSREKTS